MACAPPLEVEPLTEVEPSELLLEPDVPVELVELLLAPSELLELVDVDVEASVVWVLATALVPGLLTAASQARPIVADAPAIATPFVRARTRPRARSRSRGVSRCAVFMRSSLRM